MILEKVQVAVLAERLGVLLDELETARDQPSPTDDAPADGGPLDEPINEAFRATTLTLGWDGDAEQILVEARAEDDEDEDDEEAVVDDGGDDDDEEEEDEAVIDLSSIEGLAGSPGRRAAGGLRGRRRGRRRGPGHAPRPADAGRGARASSTAPSTVVAAGRLPCPLCGQPLDPQGHICPRRNGHYVN